MIISSSLTQLQSLQSQLLLSHPSPLSFISSALKIYLEMSAGLCKSALTFHCQVLKSHPLTQQPYCEYPQVPNHCLTRPSSPHKSQCLSQDDSYNIMIAIIRCVGLHFSILLGIP